MHTFFLFITRDNKLFHFITFFQIFMFLSAVATLARITLPLFVPTGKKMRRSGLILVPQLTVSLTVALSLTQSVH